jgi:hypothetical protein
MAMEHFQKNRAGLALIVTSILVMGCATTDSSGGSAGRIKIISEPAGATAYADGRELGVTPLEFSPGNAFRSGFVGFSYRYYGKLMLKKPGCETWSVEVNDYILSKDVHANLKCDPDYRAPVAAPSSPASPSSPPAANPAKNEDPYVERLERIETLHRKGLITDEEYRQLRSRLLDKL